MAAVVLLAGVVARNVLFYHWVLRACAFSFEMAAVGCRLPQHARELIGAPQAWLGRRRLRVAWATTKKSSQGCSALLRKLELALCGTALFEDVLRAAIVRARRKSDEGPRRADRGVLVRAAGEQAMTTRVRPEMYGRAYCMEHLDYQAQRAEQLKAVSRALRHALLGRTLDEGRNQPKSIQADHWCLLRHDESALRQDGTSLNQEKGLR